MNQSNTASGFRQKTYNGILTATSSYQAHSQNSAFSQAVYLDHFENENIFFNETCFKALKI